MGERVKIDDLARTMIRLMGRTVQDDTNPDGDIAIRYIGLRPGEKRYEELHIDDKASETEHPGIRRNDEPFLEKADLERELTKLSDALRDGSVDVIQAILARTVEGYRTACDIDRAASDGVSHNKTDEQRKAHLPTHVSDLVADLSRAMRPAI
jgi:FlaA1/EpsC-like NDP-sugar epimerase